MQSDPSTRLSLFKYSSSLYRLCFYNSYNIRMKAPSQSFSTPSCPTYSPSIMANFRWEHSNTCILFWNARGISNKKTEFFNYLEANNITIALVNETHLHQPMKFNCPNYYTYRSDRQDRPGGGTAILIRKGIKHSEIALPKLEHMEATAIQLHINSELITLVSIYNPPGKIVERDIDLLIQTNNKVILAGDFNSKHSTWNSRNDNSAGRALLSHYNKNEYLIAAPHSPTHIPDRNPDGADVLDFAILNNILSHHTVKTLGFLSHSDHRPVLLTLRGPVQSDERKSIYVYKEANWEHFRSCVHNNLNSKLLSHNPTADQIDKAVSHFTEVVHTAIQKSIPVRTRNSRSMQISPSTRLLIQERNKLRTLWQRTHNIALRPRINSLKQQIDKAIKNQLCNNWHHALQRLDTSNIQDTWRITKHLTNDYSNIPPLSLNNKSAVTQQEKVNLFADTLQEIFTTNPDRNPQFSKTTEHTVISFLNQSPTPLIRKTNSHEIDWLIQHLKSRKAAGPDGIQNIVLKNLSKMALRSLATIYNSCITISYFPDHWKLAKIIMLPKPNKDHSSPLNYRPISLLNSLAKLFEKVLLKRLHFILKKLNLIREDQYGFKKGHSTTHALLRLIERITHGFNNNKSTIALFLDIERAFDKVWITGLISKLIKAGVPAHFIHMLHSYLHVLHSCLW